MARRITPSGNNSIRLTDRGSNNSGRRQRREPTPRFNPQVAQTPDRQSRMDDLRMRQRAEARRRREGGGQGFADRREALEAQGVDVDGVLADLSNLGVNVEQLEALTSTELRQREGNSPDRYGNREASRSSIKRRQGQDEFGGDQAQLQNFGGSLVDFRGTPQSINYYQALEERLNAQRPDEGMKRSYDERRQAQQGDYVLPGARPEGLAAYLEQTINEQSVPRRQGETEQQHKVRIRKQREKASFSIQMNDSKDPANIQPNDVNIPGPIRDELGNIVGTDEAASVRRAAQDDYVGGDWLAQDFGLTQGGQTGVRTRRTKAKPKGGGKQRIDSEGRPIYQYRSESVSETPGNATAAMGGLADQIRAKINSGEVGLDDVIGGKTVRETLQNLERHGDGRVQAQQMREEGRRAVETANRRLRGEYSEEDAEFLLDREERRAGIKSEDLTKRAPGADVTFNNARDFQLFLDRQESINPGSAERIRRVASQAGSEFTVNRTLLNRALNGQNSVSTANTTTQSVDPQTRLYSDDERSSVIARLTGQADTAGLDYRERMIANIYGAETEATRLRETPVGQMPAGIINSTYQSGGNASSGLGSKYDTRVNFGPDAREATFADPVIVDGPNGPEIVGYRDPSRLDGQLGSSEGTYNPPESASESWVRDNLYTEWDQRKTSFEPPVAGNMSGTLSELTRKFAENGIVFDHDIRETGDLQAGVDAFIASKQAAGQPIYRLDPTTGKRVVAENPGISDVLSTMGIRSTGQQSQIARSLYQLGQARLNDVNLDRKDSFFSGAPQFNVNPVRPAGPRIQERTVTGPAYFGGRSQPVNSAPPINQDRLGIALDQGMETADSMQPGDRRVQRFERDRGATIGGIGNQKIRTADGSVAVTTALSNLDPMTRIRGAQEAEIARISEEAGRPLTASEQRAVSDRVFEDLDGYNALMDAGDAQGRLMGREVNDPIQSEAQMRKVYHGFTDPQIEHYYRQREANNLRRDGTPKKGFAFNKDVVLERQRVAQELRAAAGKDAISTEARRRVSFDPTVGPIGPRQSSFSVSQQNAEFDRYQQRYNAVEQLRASNQSGGGLRASLQRLNLPQETGLPISFDNGQAQLASTRSNPQPAQQHSYSPMSGADFNAPATTTYQRALPYGIDTTGPMQGANLNRMQGASINMSQGPDFSGSAEAGRRREVVRRIGKENQFRRNAGYATAATAAVGGAGFAIAGEREAREEEERAARIAGIMGG